MLTFLTVLFTGIVILMVLSGVLALLGATLGLTLGIVGIIFGVITSIVFHPVTIVLLLAYIVYRVCRR